ncbi:tyrosine-type recombinase/integrase [Desulfosporosinus sp. SYSU MS00001]|uniref:tyrosine-type recombinase/integrase n=1 Tax=Desulfosporosinus sp. SYSU MS00001 TaxID=3416284 RepID=UPI003CED062A
MEEKSVVKVIDEFLVHILDKGKSQLTAKNYKHSLEMFNHWLIDNDGDLAKLTRVDVQLFIQYLEAKGNSASTINNRFAAISQFARFIGSPNIIENIKVPQVRQARNIAPESLERTERNTLLREVERNNNPRDIAIVNLLIRTGIRVSELVALNRSDVVIGDRSGSITVRNGKGNVSRRVPLSNEARLYLTKYLETRDDIDIELFLSNYRQRISVRAVQHMLSNYGIHPHALRHTFCKELVSKGIDISTVADLAGHADINVTRRYSKPTEKDLEEAIDKAFS